ncbi:MAG: type I glutamate--ammonia ligase [Candidatus Tyrphobacter sp.]
MTKKTPQNARDAVAFVKECGAKMIDLKFTDVPGTWQHTTVPADQIDEDAFTAGTGFDGSSIRGFQSIHESDMILKPDPSTAVRDPFRTVPTVSFVCDVFDPVKQDLYERDPRNIARKAEAYLRSSGIATTAFFGPEAEFHYFDRVSYENTMSRAFYEIDTREGSWNSAVEPSGYTMRPKEAYFPVPPNDTQADLRAETALALADWGMQVEMQHHEVGASQAEINFRCDSLLRTADNLMAFKYVVKNVAARNGRTVTFMPKPVFGDNGSGMHVHQSLWKDDAPLFYDASGYGEASQLMLYYIGGLLTHIDSLLAFCAPTTNSYKRLVPHYEAPVNVAFSARNRSAAIRIPVFYKGKPSSKRLEFRPPDPAANPYLAFSALLCAGIDGIKRKIDPVAAGFGPLDENIYDLPAERAAKIRSVPGSLRQSLDALSGDHAYLVDGGVFTESFISSWIAFKTERELRPVEIRPHPYEFYLYYDC